MAFCRTKAGALRLVWEGKEIILDAAGRDLPGALAESIKGHVNVTDEPLPEAEAAPEPDPPPRRRGRRSAPEEE